LFATTKNLLLVVAAAAAAAAAILPRFSFSNITAFTDAAIAVKASLIFF
jgi:hypothetical protein